MKLKYCAGLVLVVAFASACENAVVKNSVPPVAEPTANRQTPAGAAGKASDDTADSGSAAKNAAPDEAESSGGFEGTAGIVEKKYETKSTAVLKAVRAGAHNGFDRVVFEFEGAQMPSYHIEYIDKPVRACGSGDVVPLAGDGWLEVRFSPAAAHTETGEATVRDRAQTPNLKIIREMKSTCDFEAEVEWVLGVASPNRYRVLELKNPTRLAIDINR